MLEFHCFNYFLFIIQQIRKPLMERKRRERINHSLEQLAILLKEAELVAPDKPVAKIEKADILELTVRHLKGVKEQLASQQTEEKTADSTSGDHKKDVPTQTPDAQPINSSKTSLTDTISPKSLSSTDKVGLDGYFEGFIKCFAEVREAFSSGEEYDSIKKKLVAHLENRLASLSPGEKSTAAEPKKILKRKFSEDVISSPAKKKKIKKEKSANVEMATSNPTNIPNNNSNLTLIPMRLTDGGVAFLLQGDTNLLAGDNLALDNTENSNKKFEASKIPCQNMSNNKIHQKIAIPAISKKKELPKSSVKPFLISGKGENKINDGKTLIVNQSDVNLKCRTISVSNSCYSISINPTENNSKFPSRVKTVTLPVEIPALQNQKAKAQSSPSDMPSIPESRDSQFSSNISKVIVPPSSISNYVTAPVMKTSNYAHILAKPVPTHRQPLNSGNCFISAPSTEKNFVIQERKDEYIGMNGSFPDYSSRLNTHTNNIRISNCSPTSPLYSNSSTVLDISNSHLKSFPSVATVFPPSPPPSVPLADHQIYSSPNTPASPPISGSKLSSSMSLFSTSVNLLTSPYESKRAISDEEGEEEFIDVEHTAREDNSQCIDYSVHSQQNKFICEPHNMSSDASMWRPW